jgi:hypothetical protein
MPTNRLPDARVVSKTAVHWDIVSHSKPANAEQLGYRIPAALTQVGRHTPNLCLWIHRRCSDMKGKW